MTETDVHVDGDDSDLDTRGLLHKMCSQMQQHFTALDRKNDRLGASLEKTITDKVTKVIDKRINTKTARLRKVVDDSVNDIRKEIESDMGDLTERVSEISARMESSQEKNGKTAKFHQVKRSLNTYLLLNESCLISWSKNQSVHIGTKFKLIY